MPLYEYECEDCGHRVSRLRSIAERDDWEVCPSCGPWSNHPDAQTGPGFLKRLQSAPSFTVKGFNASNGYARTAES